MGRGKGVRAASGSSIAIHFEYRGIECRERIKLPPTAANLKFVENLKGRIAHEIAIGTFDYGVHFPNSRRALSLSKTPAALVTCGELFTMWLASVYRELQQETYGDYAEYIAHTWRPIFAKVPVNQLTLDRVMTWVNAQTTSKKRILNVLTPLRQAIRYAVSPKNFLAVDPLASIKIKRAAKQKTVLIDPFSPAEIAAICQRLEPCVRNMIEFWVWSGLREGELFALTWADIDEKRGVIQVNQAVRGARVKAVKTEAGVREVKLLDPARAALNRQKSHTRLLHRQVFLHPGTLVTYRERSGSHWATSGEIVRTGQRRPSTVNRPWQEKALRNLWAEACESAGVRYRFPRQLRHTYASWMFAGREDPQWISRQMGHSHVGITLKTYTRSVQALNIDAGNSAVARILADLPGDET